MRRFFCAPLGAPGDTLTVAEADAHHLLRVVGIGPGEAVELFDGQGGAVVARLLRVEAGAAVLSVEGALSLPAPPALRLILGQLKGPAQDTALRMATEQGVSELLVVSADRSVPKGEGRPDRWERIARAAVAQCGRADLPAIRGPMRLIDALDAIPNGCERRICLPGAPVSAPAAGEVAVLVGPEGGWSPREVALAIERGCEPMSLGPWVLRADTAVVSALALARGG